MDVRHGLSAVACGAVPVRHVFLAVTPPAVDEAPPPAYAPPWTCYRNV
jgi:hypothetical protein